MSAPNTAKRTVKFKLDTQKPLPITAKQRKRLKAISELPDTKIDYSDIPRQTKRVKWSRPGLLVPIETKQQITLRLDSDVLGFFRSTGQRYQSRINAALREYVNAHRKAG
jgi:uncharacterized protein (DUF4415 family)